MRERNGSWVLALVALAAGCADVVAANTGTLDGGAGADRTATETLAADVTDEGDARRQDAGDEADVRPQDAADVVDVGRQDASTARAGYTRCRDLECDNRDQRCALCPGSEAVCAPLGGIFRCDREGALIAYCDGDEDCAGSQRCEWRMGDTLASMVCVPTNGRACNGFCGEGCGSVCERDEDCLRAACGSRCISPVPAGGAGPGAGRCR